MHEVELKLQEIDDANRVRLAVLESWQEDITGVVMALQDTLGKDVAADLEKHVSSLSLVAIDLSRKEARGQIFDIGQGQSRRLWR